MMAWQLAAREDIDELASFLSVNEWGHVAFSSRVASDGHPALPNPYKTLIYINRSGVEERIHEAVLVTRTGLVLPVLWETGTMMKRGDIARLIASNTRTLHSIMGMKSYVGAMQELVDAPKRAVIDYHLMVHDGSEAGAGTSSDAAAGETSVVAGDRAGGGDRCGKPKLKIRRARIRDCMQLYPLQQSYETEEVLLDLKRYNPSATLINLKNTIRNQIVLYAAEGRKVIAKANTNARGMKYAQIGGVYTVPEKRSRGIGALLIRELLEILGREGLGACLFVKKDNPAAVRLYEKTGFEIRGEFRIAYYEK